MSPYAGAPWDGVAGSRVTFFGHATVGVETAGTLLLTDPLLRGHVAFLRWHAPLPPTASCADVQAVLISHLHHDHCDPRSLLLLGRQRTLLVPWGTAGFFRRRGFQDVVAMRPGQVHAAGAVEVTATEAAHDGRRRPFGPSGPALGYLLSAPGLRVYYAGDTDLFPGMSELGKGLDIALLPVAGWGRTLGPGHLDPVRAAEATRLLRPSVAVPVHWGALHPVWDRTPSARTARAPALAFAAEVRRRRLPTEVVVLPPGGELSWPRGGPVPRSSV
ncbi:MAG: MBL fold metallo-hydrolase [Mycobacteriales bacterium]